MLGVACTTINSSASVSCAKSRRAAVRRRPVYRRPSSAASGRRARAAGRREDRVGFLVGVRAIPADDDSDPSSADRAGTALGASSSVSAASTLTPRDDVRRVALLRRLEALAVNRHPRRAVRPARSATRNAYGRPSTAASCAAEQRRPEDVERHVGAGTRRRVHTGHTRSRRANTPGARARRGESPRRPSDHGAWARIVIWSDPGRPGPRPRSIRPRDARSLACRTARRSRAARGSAA